MITRIFSLVNLFVRLVIILLIAQMITPLLLYVIILYTVKNVFFASPVNLKNISYMLLHFNRQNSFYRRIFFHFHFNIFTSNLVYFKYINFQFLMIILYGLIFDLVILVFLTIFIHKQLKKLNI